MKLLLSLLVFITLCIHLWSQNRDYWPTDGWQNKTLTQVNMDTLRIQAMDSVISADYDHIHSLLIVKDGYLIFEKYYNSAYNVNDFHILCSATKSVTSILVGMLLRQNNIDSLEHPIIDYFPEYKNVNTDLRLNQLTIKHMLTFTSGLDHDDDYFWQTSDIINTYLGRAFIADPGTHFNYETPASEVLSGIITKTTGKSALDFATDELFPVLGISKVYWPSDDQGYSYGGFNSYFTPRDMLKLGFLYLNHGIWNGDTLVNPEFVAVSTVAHSNGGSPHNEKYGYNWWITTINGHHTYFAGGYGGQFIIIIPCLDLVVVTTSSLDKHHEENRYLVNDYIVPAIEPLISIMPSKKQTPVLHIFPNPTFDVIHISGLTKANNGFIDLMDTTGKVLQRFSCNFSTTTIDLSECPQGIYVVRITTNDQTSAKRVMRY
ncbi:MAG: serine hydrolase [Bacteroidales bacterium]|nr:serine hydrolase [Bacteroidales bacterium]